MRHLGGDHRLARKTAIRDCPQALRMCNLDLYSSYLLLRPTSSTLPNIHFCIATSPSRTIYGAGTLREDCAAPNQLSTNHLLSSAIIFVSCKGTCAYGTSIRWAARVSHTVRSSRNTTTLRSCKWGLWTIAQRRSCLLRSFLLAWSSQVGSLW